MYNNVKFIHELLPKLGLFILWPFGAFLYSLRKAASLASYVIYVLWGILFCWHMNPTGSERYDDLQGIMARFVETKITTEELSGQIHAFFSFDESSEKEIYESILNWITRQFSDNPHSFFALASIPFLFFFLKSMKHITSDEKFTNNGYCLIVLLLFVIPRDIITVQNPRFGTGVWMAVFATIRYYSNNKYKSWYYLLILLTPCLHSGFWYYVIVFTVCMFTQQYQKILMILFCISIPFSFITSDFLLAINISLLPLPDSIILWAQHQLSEEKFAKYVLESGGRVFDIFSFFQKVTYNLIPVILWKNRQVFYEREDIRKLFSYLLLFSSITNIIQSVPVLGERFFWITQILCVYLWFKAIYPRYNTFLLVVLFSCSFYIFTRYFYHGAVSSSVPLSIFYLNTPLLIMDFWGCTSMTNSVF